MQMANRAIIHFATHGHFADNHLFSGLALEDGWLTTLDISNLRLQAALGHPQRVPDGPAYCGWW